MSRSIRLWALLCAVAILLSGCSLSGTVDSPYQITTSKLLEKAFITSPSKGFYPVAESGGNTLLFNEKTAEIAVETAGGVWYSNPQNAREDSVAYGSARDTLLSQLTFHYYNENDELKTMTSYADSVAKGQYCIEKTENGVKVYYTMGSFEKGAESIPNILSDERMQEKFLKNDLLTSSEQKWIKKHYRSESGKWIWKENDSPMVINHMLELMEKAEYTEEDLSKDRETAGVSTNDSTEIAVRFCVEYQLKNGALLISIPMEEFRFVGEMEPYKIDVLEYFGAASVSDDGYLFVPDGSGALIQLRNARNTGDFYSESVYGNDDSNTDIRLPIFGLKSANNAFIAEITEGDALGVINAVPAMIYSENANIFSSFILKNRDYATLGDGDEQTEALCFQKTMYPGTFRLQYTFLNGEKANYSGMASTYRQELIDRGVISPFSENVALPFTLQTICSVKKTKSFAGIRYKATQSLTDFSEALSLIHTLSEKGIENIQIDMLAWNKGGFSQVLLNQIDPLNDLGGKAGLKKLIAQADNDGAAISGVVSLLRFSSSGSYHIYKNAAKALDQSFLKYAPLDLVSQKKDDETDTYRLSTGRLSSMTAQLQKSMNGFENFRLTIADAGDSFTGDYSSGACIDRETAKNQIKQSLRDLSKKVKFKIAGGNLYALPFTDTVSCAPEDVSGNTVIDVSIPFYSMVFHGCLYLCGKPLVMQTDPQKMLLKTIENGYGLHSICMAADSEELKDTDQAYYYSAGCQDRLDEIIASYYEINRSVGDLVDQKILSHDIYSEDVRSVTYENNTVIYVNYSDQDIMVDGITVPAQGYFRVNGNQ